MQKETIFEQHMKDPEFAKEMFKQDLIMAITEAICETLNSYGFKQNPDFEKTITDIWQYLDDCHLNFPVITTPTGEQLNKFEREVGHG